MIRSDGRTKRIVEDAQAVRISSRYQRICNSYVLYDESHAQPIPSVTRYGTDVHE
jgi:hypothetical protein